jgi:hypothetical protein
MQESSLKSLINGNLSKIVTACMRGIYPFAFRSAPKLHGDFSLDLPIVGHQLVFSEKTQVLSFMVMDLPSLIKAGESLFPRMPRNESLKMIVSANNEILNAADSKFGLLMARIDGKNDVVITPPLVMNFSGENRLPIPCEDAVFWTFTAPEISFDFIVSVQAV